MLHARHAAVHAVLQQTPSTQALEAHCPLVVQPWPLLRLHAPAPLQVMPASSQVSGSALYLTTKLHAPAGCPGRLQPWQVPMHA